jgi:uncharacterized membrane protein YsdA (DUF1294 family)
MYFQQILIGVLVIINIVAFLIMAHDKRKAVRGNGTKRTPEGIVFFMASIFGAIGIYLAMVLLRHKTRKWYFQLGIPLLILQNVATLYLLRELFI